MSNLYYLTIVSIVFILILENRNPVKSLSWSLVLIALPILGLVLYIFLGQNVRRNKIISKKSIKQVELINGYYEAIKRKFNIRDIKLPSSLQSRRRLISLLYHNNHSLYTDDNYRCETVTCVAIGSAVCAVCGPWAVALGAWARTAAHPGGAIAMGFASACDEVGYSRL